MLLLLMLLLGLLVLSLLLLGFYSGAMIGFLLLLKDLQREMNSSGLVVIRCHPAIQLEMDMK